MLLFAPNWLFLVPGVALIALGLPLVMWLLPGPRWIGRVWFDIHTMFFGVLFTLLGMQILTIGLFAKIFSYTERFDHSNIGLSRWLRRLPLESGLLVGTVLAVVGFLGDCGHLLEVEGGGVWPVFRNAMALVLVDVVFHRGADRVLVLLHEHARRSAVVPTKATTTSGRLANDC